MLKVEEHIDQELMVKLNFILNTTLNGLDVTGRYTSGRSMWLYNISHLFKV